MQQYLNDIYALSDTDILKRIGAKLKTARLNENITREELQNRTGVHVKTIGDAESGKNMTLLTFISILRGLDMLQEIGSFIEEESIDPIVLAKRQGNIPKKASRRRS